MQNVHTCTEFHSNWVKWKRTTGKKERIAKQNINCTHTHKKWRSLLVSRCTHNKNTKRITTLLERMFRLVTDITVDRSRRISNHNCLHMLASNIHNASCTHFLRYASSSFRCFDDLQCASGLSSLRLRLSVSLSFNLSRSQIVVTHATFNKHHTSI